MVLVDSTVWIDYLRMTPTAETEWLDSLLPHKRIGLPDLVLHEVLMGAPGQREFRHLQSTMRLFSVLPTGGEQLAVAAASNYRLLRSRGVTVRKSIDCLIGTFCIVNGHSLLHRDRDFDPFEKHLGLHVIHPPRQIQ